jgi:CheY-like chemotaxis protein
MSADYDASDEKDALMKTILVVDDDDDLRSMTSRVLTAWDTAC